jgi:hypothetical protein
MDLRETLMAAEHSFPEFEISAKVAALLLTILFVSPALGQWAATPTLEQCEQHLESCRAECRARNFAVDPHREVCLKDCGELEVTCTRSADPGAQVVPRSQNRPISMQRR